MTSAGARQGWQRWLALATARTDATGKWYSRDVAAIAVAQGLSNVAPYFVDADKSGTAAPVGGLTIIAFPNNHLVYMLTWFALAAMTIVAFVVFVRQDARKRREEA